MKTKTILTKAEEDYKLAYTSHYSEKNLKGAFDLYRRIITDHPESHESIYSRKQIENIVAQLIPKQEIFDVLINKLLKHFEKLKYSTEKNKYENTIGANINAK